MSMLSRLFSFGFKRVRNQISSLDQKIDSLLEKKKIVDQNSIRSLARLAKAEEVLRTELESTRLALKNSNTINVQLEETLSAVRDELRTVQRITIPGLVAANQVFLDRWEAESKIQVMRSVFADLRKETE